MSHPKLKRFRANRAYLEVHRSTDVSIGVTCGTLLPLFITSTPSKAVDFAIGHLCVLWHG